MKDGGNGRVRFAHFELDFRTETLYRENRPVKIQPQPLRVLGMLVEQAGDIVSREQLRQRIWGDATFVEFDHGLNYCIRQIRIALRDEASAPVYIETLPKQGYRFIAPVAVAPDLSKPVNLATPTEPANPEAIPVSPQPPPAESVLSSSGVSKFWTKPRLALAALMIFATLAAGLFSRFRVPPAELKYTQLTDFTDSALAPALSPDGHMVAFLRGTTGFMTADQVYVKVLPNGEARRLTNDSRLKYNLAFSPDGAQIAYTVFQPPSWSTYTVSVFGGESHLFLSNAAGLNWLDQHQLLFSRTRTGQHMGIVSGTTFDQEFREHYFPPHERAMAHFSSASPDHQSALVVEMGDDGGWTSCKLISLNGRFAAKPIGPQGPCTSAGWSPDGSWMYFTALLEGRNHLWRQHFPSGNPQQITSGPMEEDGVAVEGDGRSLITSIGVHESAIWFHDANGERSLSSEGEIVTKHSPPAFSADDSVLYYLLKRGSDSSRGPELWRVMIGTSTSEPVLPGVSMLTFDVSPDGKQVVFSTATSSGEDQLWLAFVDRSTPPKRIGVAAGLRPHFGPVGEILFQAKEGNFNYLERMKSDGSGRVKVVPYPISTLQSISPGRRWVMAAVPLATGPGVELAAIPVSGGPKRIICANYCVPRWSSTGNFLVIPVEAASMTSPGRSLAIPVGANEALPDFPPGGIETMAQAGLIAGGAWIARSNLIPGKDPAHFAYVNTTAHRNLYRISLP